MYIHVKDGSCLFAGLYYTQVRERDDIVHCCVIVTTQPNKLVADIHHRMPAILHPKHQDVWLYKELKHVLKPFPAERIEAYTVSHAVNNVANDLPDLIHAIIPQ